VKGSAAIIRGDFSPLSFQGKASSLGSASGASLSILQSDKLFSWFCFLFIHIILNAEPRIE
jgi:hypothetical protein